MALLWLLAAFRKVVRLPLSPLVSCHDVFSIDTRLDLLAHTYRERTHDMYGPLYGSLTPPGPSPDRSHGHDRTWDDAGRGGHHLTGPLSHLYPAVHAHS